jgi:hypothetical protein
LNVQRILKSFMARQSILLLTIGLSAAISPAAPAQTSLSTATSTLPDAPDAASLRSVDVADNFSTSAEPHFDSADAVRIGQPAKMAPRWHKVIQPSEQAAPLTAGDKFFLGVKDSVTPLSISSWIISSGYSHLTNGPPNYGTDKGAYGQRLGATAIRDISEDVFSTSIMANVFREDPRYYKMGRGHSIGRRVFYAATRVLITRTDNGSSTPNFSLITGNLAGVALTNAYYPPLNHGAKQTMLIFGSSLGGSALGFGVSEFLGDALELVHLKKSE